MFTCKIKTDNAAFASAEYSGDREGDSTPCKHEVARILRDIAAKLEWGNDCGNCRDYNGNTVGTWELES